MNRFLSLAGVLSVTLLAAGVFLFWTSDTAPSAHAKALANPTAPSKGLDSTPLAAAGEDAEKISPTEELVAAVGAAELRRRPDPGKQSAETAPSALQRAATPSQASASTASFVMADASPKDPGAAPVGAAGEPGSASSEAASFQGVASAVTDSPMPLPLPLAFLDPSPGIKLDDHQVAAIDRLRQDFVDAVGGREQDPNDPAYLPRWTKALPENDARLRFILGVEGYRQYMYQAMQEAAGPKGWFTQQLHAAPAPAQR